MVGIGWRAALVGALQVAIVLSMLVAIGFVGISVFGGMDDLPDDDAISDTVWDTLDIDNSGENESESDEHQSPPSDSDGESFSVHRVERLVEEEVNEIRATEDLSTLTPRADVARVARNHSQDMYEADYFSHVTPEGDTPQDRIDTDGVSCTVGENIAFVWYEPHLPPGHSGQGLESEEDVASFLVEQWMESPGHRENILTGPYRSHGVGVYLGDEGEVLATHKFCVE